MVRRAPYTAPTMPDSLTRDDPLDEARRLVALASGRGIVVRLLGGIAFQAHLPGSGPATDRRAGDIDLATLGRHGRALGELLVGSGYDADREYNALHGHKQLYFVDQRTQRPLDVLVDQFEMCHRFQFGDRLLIDPLTLSLADLLLTKLQIVKINRKDLVDIALLLSRLPLSLDEAGISLRRLTEVTSTSWGWWRTVTGNLDRVESFIAGEPELGRASGPGTPTLDPIQQLHEIRAAIDAAPKSFGWRLRSAIGDRAVWYDEPEEVGHGPI